MRWLVVLALVACDTSSRRAPPPPVIDAAPVVVPAVIEPPKLVAYRDFLAEVDTTLHGLRLGCHHHWLAYLSWDWPQWLTPEHSTRGSPTSMR